MLERLLLLYTAFTSAPPQVTYQKQQKRITIFQRIAHAFTPFLDMSTCTIIALLLQLITLCVADHYEGGTIVWRPVNPYSISGPVQIIIEHRQSFTASRYLCNLTTIASYGTITDNQNAPPPALTCISSSTLCTTSGFQTINSSLICDDISSVLNYTSGTLLSTQTLPLNTEIDIAWRGAAWINPMHTNAFSLVSHISLTPLNSGKINSAPGKSSLCSQSQIYFDPWFSGSCCACH